MYVHLCILDVVRRHENKTTLESDVQSDKHVLLIGNLWGWR